MRLYTFTNFYLSSIQQGIQPAHVVSELFVKYSHNSHEYAKLMDWAANHKTMICLNGGNMAGVAETLTRLQELAPKLALPFACFFEDQQSLGSTLTSCGVVVPRYLYDNVWVFDTPERPCEFTEPEQQLMTLIRTPSLAK